MKKTGIQWTDSTWNPATGCTKVSTGCANCYADELAKKMQAQGVKKYKNGFLYTEHTDTIDWPMHKKKPLKIFVNSMSDVFHENATEEFLLKIFYVMKKADWHIFQILTKRPQLMRDFIDRNKMDIPPHIWLGTSVENQSTTHRIDTLREVSCPVKFISFEPLLGLIESPNLDDINWAIIGGESGENFRPVEKNWVRKLVDSCLEQKVACFFKQWGGEKPKSGGRMLDGKIYDEYPEIEIKRGLDMFK